MQLKLCVVSAIALMGYSVEGLEMKENGKKIAVITGGTSGIGLASAAIFLSHEYRVVLIGRSAEKGMQALKTLNTPDEDVLFLSGDITKVRECQRLVAQVISNFGKIDALVNSAGIYIEKSIEDMDEAAYEQIMDSNIKGTYFMCQQAAIQMKKQNSGAIINVSSDAGVNGNFCCSAYCASKGAVTVFSKALALELAPYNIRVNCVCPGDIDTPMTRAQFTNPDDITEELREMTSVYPIGRIGKANEVAEVIYFLASEKATFVVGAAWGVDGGVTAY